MRLLLDTHVAIWSVSSSQRLPSGIIDLIAEPENEVFVSIATIWEIAVKNSPGRRVKMPFSAAVAAYRFREFGFATLGIETPQLIALETLPSIHRDPFDRLLLAQARVAAMQLVTHDQQLAAYGDLVISF